jgi:hypothetical protein
MDHARRFCFSARPRCSPHKWAGQNRIPVGMNAPMADQNYRFVLNLMHWLSGLLP